MRLIPIIGKYSKGKFAIVDDDVFQNLKGAKINLQGGNYPRVSFKCVVTGKRSQILLHRLVMGAVGGEMIDHKSTNTLDNRRSNLRFCTASQNLINRRKRRSPASSKYKGVSWNKKLNKWLARASIGPVKIGNRRGLVFLGLYDDEEKARQAYINATKEVFGELANYKTEGTK